MQKIASSVIFLVLTITGFAQSDKCNSILWTEKMKLKWSDFKANPDTTVSFKAVSVPSIGYTARMANDSLFIDIKCIFKPCESWTKLHSTSLLKHEQTHFDISEYFKRVYVQRLLMTHFTRQNSFIQIRDIYKEISKLIDDLNQRYDKETNLSMNKIMQDKWSKEMRVKINKIKSADKKKVIVYLRD